MNVYGIRTFLFPHRNFNIWLNICAVNVCASVFFQWPSFVSLKIFFFSISFFLPKHYHRIPYNISWKFLYELNIDYFLFFDFSLGICNTIGIKNYQRKMYIFVNLKKKFQDKILNFFNLKDAQCNSFFL